MTQTLNILPSTPGDGTSQDLCQLAALYLNAGKKVIYITLELTKEAVLERIFHRTKEINAAKNLAVKEFRTGTLNELQFQEYLDNMRLTEPNLRPDLIIIDYLGLCDIPTYDLSYLAATLDVPIWTKKQVHRSVAFPQ